MGSIYASRRLRFENRRLRETLGWFNGNSVWREPTVGRPMQVRPHPGLGELTHAKFAARPTKEHNRNELHLRMGRHKSMTKIKMLSLNEFPPQSKCREPPDDNSGTFVLNLLQKRLIRLVVWAQPSFDVTLCRCRFAFVSP